MKRPAQVDLINFGRYAATGVAALLFGVAAYPALANIITPPRTGCPVFHCTNEATGVMYQPILATQPLLTAQRNDLGSLKGQGCSGDGAIIACLYPTDAVGTGTLKILDAGTLTPKWASKTPGSYDISGSGFSIGEVPYILPNGQIAAGDSGKQALYDGATGALVKPLLQLNPQDGKNWGITPLVNGMGISAEDNDYAVISQGNAAFTLIKISSWTQVGPTLRLTGVGNEAVALVSSSSGSGNNVYAVASNGRNSLPTRGYLFALHMDTGLGQLVQGPTYQFIGTAGASPVVLKPSISGQPNNIILLHAPGLVVPPINQDALIALTDNGTSLDLFWPNPVLLTQGLDVSPAIDEVSKSLFYEYTNQPDLYQVDFRTGLSTSGPYHIDAASGLPHNFKLNGHIGAIQAGGTLTLLLSGGVRSGSTAGQYEIAFQPFVNPTKDLWKLKVLSVPATTAAWNIAGVGKNGTNCPIVVTSALTGNTSSGVSLICDH